MASYRLNYLRESYYRLEALGLSPYLYTILDYKG